MKKKYTALAAALICFAFSLTSYADTISDVPFGAENINTETTEIGAQSGTQDTQAAAGQEMAAPVPSGFIDIDTAAIGSLPSAQLQNGSVEETAAPAAVTETAAADTNAPGAVTETAAAAQFAPAAETAADNSGAPAAETSAPAASAETEAAPPAISVPEETAPQETQPQASVQIPSAGENHTTTAGPDSVSSGTADAARETSSSAPAADSISLPAINNVPPSVISAPAQDEASANAAGTASATGSGPSAGNGGYGSIYANGVKSRLDLGFTLVSPAVSMNGFKVAEGSVQLSDGSWDSIARGANIRYPYFKLLREQTDNTGTAWYVVAMAGRKVGDYATPDGSVPAELWLKKSDCTAQSWMDLDTANETRRQIVRNAMALLGCRYRYAGNGPDVFDCSGFVHYVMESVGISVPRTSTELCSAGQQVGAEGLRPGDIVGRPGHVGIYIGDGYFVHASESSTGVITESIPVYERNNHFTNFVNVVGD